MVLRSGVNLLSPRNEKETSPRRPLHSALFLNGLSADVRNTFSFFCLPRIEMVQARHSSFGSCSPRYLSQLSLKMRSRRVTFDPSLGGTTQTIIANIDPGNVLQESNAANNTASVQVDVDNTLTINNILAQNVTVSSTGTITGLVDLSYTYDGVPVNTSVPFCTSCGQPVSLASGSMWHQMTDLSVPGRTPATTLTLMRTYIAHPVTQGHDFGPNWFSNFETRILPLSSGTNPNLAWIDESGGVWVFTQNSNGSFTPPSGFHGTLVQTSNAFQLTRPRGISIRPERW
jgi:hypothetical protein